MNLGVNFNNIDISVGYKTQGKSRDNSPLYGAGENNWLPLQTINSNHVKEALTGTTNALSLPSTPKSNSTCMNLGQNSTIMKCYFHYEQNCFLDYFKDPVLDHTVIYVGNVPFQCNKQEDKYTEFVGNLTGNIFVAANRDYEFLLRHKGNATYIPNSSNNFRKLNVVENSSNLIQILPPNPGNSSHPEMPKKEILTQIT